METVIIKNVFMEIRSRLRSCNVYLTTDLDFTRNTSLRISLRSNCIIINYNNIENDEDKIDDEVFEKYKRRTESYSSVESALSSDFESQSEDDSCTSVEVIDIEQFCRIIPNSMSGLKIEKGNVSFRILTEPKTGNVYKEIINLSSVSTSNNVEPTKLQINIDKNEVVNFHCANCSNKINEDAVKFKRVLELPSENMDVSEWFCCSHGHGSSESGHAQTLSNLTPNKDDLFYRISYFILNKDILIEKCNEFNRKRTVYHCNRCLAWLGVFDTKKSSVKFYNSSLFITKQNNNFNNKVQVFNVVNVSNFALNDKLARDDFVYTIETMMKDFNLGMQYSIMCKLLLECNFAAGKKQYLLIWIMDKDLQILKGSNVNDVNSSLNLTNDSVKLTAGFTTKLLYRVEDCLNDVVESWISDSCVTSGEISKSMLLDGVQHLKLMSEHVPQCFRTSNGFSVSYLRM